MRPAIASLFPDDDCPQTASQFRPSGLLVIGLLRFRGWTLVRPLFCFGVAPGLGQADIVISSEVKGAQLQCDWSFRPSMFVPEKHILSVGSRFMDTCGSKSVLTMQC